MCNYQLEDEAVESIITQHAFDAVEEIIKVTNPDFIHKK